MKTSSAIKVGLLTIISTIILILGVMWLKGRSISVGERIEVQFKDIDGMRPGSAVQMMGMRIGQVDEIIPVIDGENSYIKIKFVITEPNVQIPYASKISIQQSGIIGEKFIEVTPPFPKTLYMPVEKANASIRKGSKIKLLIADEYREIGETVNTEIIKKTSVPADCKKDIPTSHAFKIEYIITKPGIIIPKNSSKDLVVLNDGQDGEIRFTPPESITLRMPLGDLKYTIEEPLRMKDFLDIQLESAIALKETNDKVNSLFSNEFIDDVRLTFENTKDLTEKASGIMAQASEILDSSRDDIETLIVSATELSENMTVLTANINEIVGDEEFRKNLIATVNSIKESSDQVSILLAESKLKESLLNINRTTEDLSEVVHYVNDLTKNEEIGEKLDETVVNLNTSLVKLTRVIDVVEELTVEEKDRLKKLINDSSETFDNLKDVSEKLNGRFMLLKMLF